MPALLEVKADFEQLNRIANLIGAAGKNAPLAIARAVNHTGDKAKTQMIRALTAQTGLQRKTIVKALHVTRASQGTLTYTINSAGGDVSLKYFGARETKQGVSAAPWGHRQIFAGSFIKGGRFPNRVTARRLNGHVYERAGSSRLPLHKLDSGLYIPVEMVKGATAAAFREAAERDLPDRLAHELTRILG